MNFTMVDRNDDIDKLLNKNDVLLDKNLMIYYLDIKLMLLYITVQTVYAIFIIK